MMNEEVESWQKQLREINVTEKAIVRGQKESRKEMKPTITFELPNRQFSPAVITVAPRYLQGLLYETTHKLRRTANNEVLLEMYNMHVSWVVSYMHIKLSNAVNGIAEGPLCCMRVLGIRKIALMTLPCFSTDELGEYKYLSWFSASVELHLHRHLCACNYWKQRKCMYDFRPWTWTGFLDCKQIRNVYLWL